LEYLSFPTITASGGIAHAEARLWQIQNFYDAEGNFLLGDEGEYVTIYNGKGEKSEIYLDGEDTISEVADKIENAIVNPSELDMGWMVPSVDEHVADYIAAAAPGTDESVAGTIVVRSPRMGKEGEFFFAGDEAVLNAFGFATIHEASDNYEMNVAVTTTDSAGNAVIVGNDILADATIHEMITGVDVELDSHLGMNASWDAANREIVFMSGTETETVAVIDQAAHFQIGAYEGDHMTGYIGEMSADALGIGHTMVIDPDVAADAITDITNAIERVSSERARIGSVINRLSHTEGNLGMQKEHAFGTASKIRDLDVAKESAEFARNNMLTQAAQSMIGQANRIPESVLQLLR